MALPYPAIKKIPNTEPSAIPALWNDTYVEIDANFASLGARMDAVEADMVVTLADLGITTTAAKINFLSSVTSDVQAQINAKVSLPAGGTALQYIRGDGTAATFPTTWGWAAISGKPTTFAASGMTLAAGDVPTLNQSTTGSAATLTTARTLTIGSSGKAFNGSANVSWTLVEIGAAAASHSHVIGDVTGLQAALDSKSGSAHNHTLNSLSNVTITNAAVGDLLSWNGTGWVNAASSGSGFAPGVHTHAITDVTGLQAALDGKLATTGTAASSTKLATARLLTIGGTARGFDGTGNLSWTLGEIGAAAASHSHVIGDVTGLQAALDSKSGSAHSHTFDGLSNVTTTNKAAGDLPQWNGSAWVNASLAAAGIAAASHTHVIGSITGLQGALDSRAVLGANVNFNSVTAAAFSQSSSRRYKSHIEQLSPDDALSLLSSLSPASYRMRADGSRAFGVIAEDVAGGPLGFAVKCDADGRPDSVDYQPLFMVTLSAMQGLVRRVAALEARNG